MLATLHRWMPPPLLAALCALGGWALHRAWPAARLDSATLRGLAVLLALAALGLMLAAVWTLWRARTTVDPLHPQRTSRLGERGPFARSRNPIYLGDALLLLAFALWLGQPLALLAPLLFVLLIDRGQIRADERALQQLFGAEYRAYCARVRRWV